MLPVLDLNDTKAVADFIMDRCAPALTRNERIIWRNY